MVSIILRAMLLSMLPISELRGGIPYAIANGVKPINAFIFCVIANILVIFIVFFFLDYLHKHFMKINFYRRLFEIYINRSRRKLENHVGTRLESIMLFLFVAVPLPLTGAYTGSVLAWLFGLNRKKSFIAIALGVIIAGIIVTLATVGVVKLL